ncbi:sugar transferase [Microbacterium imperiale]|uniref:Polyprenyl glycosylphosphotransferase n=1 Tax=Microbacterium imperiale TaxID=33884 RepID=A0A9W6HG69_9MICO|nr:sugar transferase [Microbacterium imperiale]MBP2420461.1 exopolysaccharide biosynthesis polyprenyl glycosylphosphotransferase [Microbacterium imperiale]BFE40802.1 sugar transferase [Microbacterium imperiale]GLJ79911.1 polyprenyl glycosylphosphotransferase [Microbacterium imperiale]
MTDTLVAGTAVAAAGAVSAQLGSSPPVAAAIAAATATVWLVGLSLFGSREPRAMGAGSSEYKRVANATGVAFGILAVAFEIAQWDGLRMQMVIALPAGLLALLIARWRWRAWLRARRRRGEYASLTLIAGRRRDVDYVTRQLALADNGYAVIALALTDLESAEASERVHAVRTAADIADVAREVGADTIVVASIPDDDPDFSRSLAWQLEGTAAELIMSSRLADVAGPRISLSPIEGLPLIHVKIPVFEGAAHTLKRLLDLVVSAAASAAVALATPVIALAIKLDSPGPVFYRQRRVGRDGREFTMFKFRSMTDTAEQELAELLPTNDGAGPLFKLRVDPRVTRVGRVLRRYSLDELPQFFNVLRGDMSISGPRPPLPSEVRNYEGRVFRRLYIKPGITGLWQVGGRSDLSWEDSVALDLRYVENWSVTLDLMIMWRTVKVMLRPVGAY